MRWRLAWVRQRVQGQPRLYSKMVFFFKNKRKGRGRKERRKRKRKEEKAKLKHPSASSVSVQVPPLPCTKVHCTHLSPGTHGGCIRRPDSSGGMRTKVGTRRPHCFLSSHQARVVFPTPCFAAGTGSVEECNCAPVHQASCLFPAQNNDLL